MIIKINNLTNLQDARYCAAMGVDVLTFAAGEGCLHKLPDAMIAEIAGWVEGPEIVLNYGRDHEHAETYVETFACEVEIAVQPVGDDSFSMGENYWLTIEISEDDSPASTARLIQMIADGVRYLEIAPTGPVSWLKKVLLPVPNLIINLDFCPLEVLQGLDFKPAGVSMRRCVEQDLLQLDYDACEAMFAALEHYRTPA